MKDMMNRLSTELAQIRMEEEMVMCFLTDLQALDLMQVDTLLRFYHLQVTKGPNFEAMYNATKQKMEDLARREQDAERERQTKIEEHK